MEKMMNSLDAFDYSDARVLLRLDINCPIDRETGAIVNDERIVRSLPTIRHLLSQNAKIAILAHQGDTLDYHNLVPLEKHAVRLAERLGHPVRYIDDVCGPAAVGLIRAMKSGDVVLLGNLRYLCEEVSTFENDVKLTPEAMEKTWLVRTLAPLFDFYVNEAFSAAHRNCPSQVAFQRCLPSAAGRVFFEEYEALNKLLHKPIRPATFILGGAKISDAFGMLEGVLKNGTADRILTGGVTGNIFLLAAGFSLGAKTEQWIRDRSLERFIDPARRYLEDYRDRVYYPFDLAYADGDRRVEISRDALPAEDALLADIGTKTIHLYEDLIESAGSVFVNGPMGMYEDSRFEKGTKAIWGKIAQSSAYSVLGGGDSVTAGQRFGMDGIDYVCTAGGAMVRFMAGKTLPLIDAMVQKR